MGRVIGSGVGRLAAWMALLGFPLAGLCGCGSDSGSTATSGSAANAARGSASSEAAPGSAMPRSTERALVTRNTTRLGGVGAETDAAAVAEAVYPGLTPASRPRAVVLVDRGDWDAALSAASLASAPLNAPLLYAERRSLPELTGAALREMDPTGSRSPGRVQVIELGTEAGAGEYRLRRITDTGAALAASVEGLLAQARGSRPRRVIVVDPDGPRALAMPAAGLAAESGAPILFANGTELPRATREVLRDLGRPSIYVLAPSSEIGPSVMSELKRLGPTTRVAASGAAANSVDVAEYANRGFGWGVDQPGHGLVFASAGRPFDGPAAALLSATGDYGPLLLLEEGNRIPAALGTFLSDIQPGYASAPRFQPVRGVYNHGWLIGGEEAISATVQAKLDADLEISRRATQESGPEGQPSSETREEGRG